MIRYACLFICLLSNIAFAKPHIVVDDKFSSKELGTTGGILEDPTSKLTISEAINLHSEGQFSFEPRKKASLGFSTSTWWLTATVSNPTKISQKVYFSHNYAATDIFDIWLVDSDSEVIFSGRSGDIAERQENTFKHRLATFQVDVPPGDHQVYFTSKSRGAVSLDIHALSTETFSDKKVIDYSIIIATFTVITIMGLYNLCIFLQLRKKIYLYYVFFAMMFSFQCLGLVGFYRLMFENYTFISNFGFNLQSLGAILSVYLFVYYFLELYRSKVLGLICVGLSLFVMVAMIVTAFDYTLGTKLSVLVSFSLSLFCIVSGVVRSAQRFRPAYFYTAAWILILAANLTRMLVMSGNLPPSIFSDFGVHFGLVVEAVLISLGLADKIRLREKKDLERISSLNTTLKEESQKVRDLNEHLEERVEEQTREIKSIMRNIQLGIVVIEGEDLHITGTYSDAVKDIFEVRDVGGMEAVQLLFHQALVSRELRDQIATIISTSLDEDPLVFECNEHLLPTEVVYQYEQKKILQFDWKPVVDNNDLIEKVIVAVKDVTSLKVLEEESKNRERELLFLGEILSISPRKFSQFMEASVGFMSDNKRVLQLNQNIDQNSLKLIFINLHTIKGAARALDLNQLTPVVHEAEQTISDMMTGEQPVNRDLCITENAKVETLLDYYQNLNSEKLGRSSGEVLSITQDLANRIHRANCDVMDEVQVEKRLEIQEINSEIEKMTFLCAGDLFSEILMDVEMLARDLDKEYPTIEVNTEGIHFSIEGQKLLRNAFVHIIRNSMDHGIETPDIREKLGKSPAGHIFVRLQEKSRSEGKYLEICYGDDGAGLNLKSIHELAVKKGVIDEGQSLPPEELAQLIFHSGFSTSKSLSDISGRGVGMSAIREYFQKHEGRVTLEIFPDDRDGLSDDSMRFQLTMTVPSKYYINRSSDRGGTEAD